jgi:hypothetical protein
MSEWQPARIRKYHQVELSPFYAGDEAMSALRSKVVRVRPTSQHLTLGWHETVGCPVGSQMYQIHPEDCAPQSGDLICEHEILTD